MPPDPTSFRNRVLLDLVGSPWVLLPTAAGMSGLMMDWAFAGGAGPLTFAGLAGLAVGAGALISRWLTAGDALTAKAVADLEAHELQQRQARLDALDRRLAADGDDRTNRALAGLRELERRVSDLESHDDPARRPPPEIAGQIRELLHTSITSLERSAELHETLHLVVTPDARRRVADTRNALLGEVEASVDQIVTTLDGLYTLGLDREKPEARLARMRRELDASLDVARNVERRLAELETSLDPTHDRLSQI